MGQQLIQERAKEPEFSRSRQRKSGVDDRLRNRSCQAISRWYSIRIFWRCGVLDHLAKRKSTEEQPRAVEAAAKAEWWVAVTTSLMKRPRWARTDDAKRTEAAEAYPGTRIGCRWGCDGLIKPLLPARDHNDASQPQFQTIWHVTVEYYKKGFWFCGR